MENPPETDTGAAFAAGVATATAEQASADAAGAEFRAEIAAGDAAAAAERAADAETAAWDARAAVDGLRSDMMAALDDIRESLSGKGGAGGRDDTGTAAPAPERKEDTDTGPTEPVSDEPKPRRAYGSRAWFGS